MAIIDVHTHIYPEKIAQKASDSVGQFYLSPMYGDGSVDGERGLLAGAEGCPVTHFVVHSVAVKPQTVESINNFIADECAKHSNFIGFMSMHQDFPDPLAEIERAMALGLRGIKLHPDTQMVNADDPRLMRVYEIAEAKGLPLIIHTGDYRYDYSSPYRIANILHTFPKLVVDAAHFGGWSVFDLGFEVLEHENCFVDCSSAFTFLGKRRSRELIELYGPERVMFGADFPMWSTKSEYDFFDSLGFTGKDRENILWHNAERFLGMQIE